MSLIVLRTPLNASKRYAYLVGKNKQYSLKVRGILNAWVKKILTLFDIRITNPLTVSIRSL
ncbi:hypothetical protein BB407_01230 [Helicobacter pylori]|nr:hypothetical protein BB407_01230 [Helicobacter pylori]